MKSFHFHITLKKTWWLKPLVFFLVAIRVSSPRIAGIIAKHAIKTEIETVEKEETNAGVHE